MEEDVSVITRLPQELIGCILQLESLNMHDVNNFSLTCKHFYKTLQENDHLWRIKFFQRWPHLTECYESHRKNVTSWREEAYSSVKIRDELISELSLMSRKFYDKPDLSYAELKYLERLFRPELGAHPFAYDFLVDELISLINSSNPKFNLTDKYYAYKLIRYFKQCYLTDEWDKFLSLPANLQTMEYGAVFVSQWSQPEKRISYSEIALEFDKIVYQIKEVITNQHPDHPVLFTSEKTFQLWKYTNIADNQWDKTRSLQIISAMCEVLFDKMQFNGNSDLYYTFGNLFIDQALKRRQAVPIMLAIIFESVARRLGVRCEPVSFPSHFLLRWKEKYAPSDTEYESFYIDFFNKGRFLTKNSCPRIDGASRCPIAKYNYAQTTVKDVTEKIIYNLEIAVRTEKYKMHRRSILELHFLIKPYDSEVIMTLNNYYVEHQLNSSYVLERIKNSTEYYQSLWTLRIYENSILHAHNNYQNILVKVDVAPKVRSPELKYAVGMIMMHKIGYKCVIIGWETNRDMPKPGCLIEYDFDKNSPSYYVLVEDGSFRYTPEVSLKITPTPSEINHEEIGRYFYQYCDTYYLPNRETEIKYPEDANIRRQLLKIPSKLNHIYK